MILSLLLRMCIISWNDFVYDVVQTRPQTIFGWLGSIFINLWEEYHFWLMWFSRAPTYTLIPEIYTYYVNALQIQEFSIVKARPEKTLE